MVVAEGRARSPDAAVKNLKKGHRLSVAISGSGG
jgi:hypothetical protein